MTKVLILILFAALTLVAPARSAKTWQLYHSLDSGKTFSERGTISLALNDEGQPEMKVEHRPDCLDLGAINTLTSGFYQVKLVRGSQSVLTSVPACQVRRANFRDEILITLNAQAEAVSLSYTPLVSPLAPPCAEISDLTEAPSFNTVVSFETATPGMTIPTLLPLTKPPPGLTFFPRSQGGAAIPGVKPEAENTSQSFLLKYWYIILPLVIMGMTGGADVPSEESAAAPPAGGGVAATAAAPTVRAAPTAAASPQGKVRRGKRS